MKAGERAMVFSTSCEMIGGSTVRQLTEPHEAILIRPVGGSDSRVWWVRFDDDPAERVRQVERVPESVRSEFRRARA